MEGKFIVFEGGEGSGKTTQAQILAEKLKEKGFEVILTHEPGSLHSEICQKIREIILFSKEDISPWAIFFLFMADRAEHVEKVIKPALKSGKIVISDRYFLSTIAYQHFGLKLPLAKVLQINKIACQNLIPDLVFFLNTPPEVGLLRLKKSGKKLTNFDKKDLEFHQKVYKGFLKIAQNPQRYHIKNLKIIDGTLKIEEIAQIILQESLKIF